jgi:hypothetical protein
MKRFTYCLFIICLLTSCSDYLDKVVDFLDKESLEITKKYNLTYGGHGGSYNNEKAESLLVWFYKNKKIKLDEARKLVIQAHRDFYTSIKREKALEEFINADKFTMHNFKLKISFKNKENTFFYNPYVGSVISSRGLVRYNFFDEKTGKETEYKETFEEAYRIVEEEERLNNR